VLAPGCSKKSRASRYLEKANTAYKSGQLDRAEILYLNVRNLDRLNPSAIRQLGVIYHEEGRVAQAFPYLQRAAEDAPDNHEVQLKLASCYQFFHKYKEAREEVLKVLSSDPDNEEALLLMIDASRSTNEVLDAEARIASALTTNPAKAAPHIGRGALLFRQQDFDGAEKEFRKASELDPKSGSAFGGLGSVYSARKDTARAGESFQKSYELSPPRSGNRLRYASFKMSIGARDDARKLLSEMTSDAPDYLPGWVALMQLAFAEKQYDEANALANRILARDTVNYDGLLMHGNVLLAKNEPEKAFEQFRKMSDFYDGVPQVHYEMAMACLMMRNVPKAIASLNRALALDPSLAQATLVLAELNMRTGNAATAVAALNKLLKDRPDLSQGYVLLGSAYLAENQPDDAIAAYQKLALLSPKSPEPLLLIGGVLGGGGKYPEARSLFEKALALSPEYAPAIECLLSLDITEKNFPAALKLASGQAQKQPKSSAPQLMLARVYLAQKDNSRAESVLQKAIELDPSQKSAYTTLAQLYVDTGRQKEALARLNSFVSTTNDAGAFVQIGVIHQQLNELPAARDAYEKALTINPNFTTALNNLAYLYSEHFGQIDKAYTMAEKARQLRPSDPYTADTLGWILFKRGEYVRSLGLIQEAVSQLASDPEIQFHLGMVDYMTGDEESARKSLRQAVDSDRKFAGKDEAKRRLDILALDTSAVTSAVIADLEQRFHQDPKDAIVAKRLAGAYEKTAAFNKAVDIYQQMLKSNPDNPAALGRLADLYTSHLNDPQKALELAKQAHKLAPDNPGISRTLGSLVLAQGDYKWSSSLLEDASQKLPPDPVLSYDLAWAYYNLGRVTDSLPLMQKVAASQESLGRQADAKQFVQFATAFENPANTSVQPSDIRNALTAKPDYLPALMASGAMNEAAGNAAESKRLYEQALRKNPLFLPAVRRLALLEVRSFPDDPNSYDLCAKARESFPNDPEVSKAFGIASYRRGDFQRCSQLLKEYIRSNTDDPDVLYYLGMAHYRLKQSQESKGELQRALAMNSKSSMAEEARRVLAELK
jgi:tetratricopeptide (TPR) repeat protein